MPVTFGTDTSWAQFSMFRHLATCVRMYVYVCVFTMSQNGQEM